MKKINLCKFTMKTLQIAVCIAIISLGFSACPDPEVPKPVTVTGVSISVEGGGEPIVAVGGELQLLAVISPADAANKEVFWTSEVDLIAEVDELSGLVLGKVSGVTTIYVETIDGGFTDSIEITVSAIPVDGVTLNITERDDLQVGTNFTLTATVTPPEAGNRNITWSTSDATVASLSGSAATSRLVTGLKAGTAVITVETVDGGFTATCNVTVVPAKVTSVTLDLANRTLLFLEPPAPTFTLTATVLPSIAENKDINWKTSDSAVATVANGVVTAVGGGTAVITAESDDDPTVTAECNVTVLTAIPENPVIDDPSEYITVGTASQTGTPEIAAALGFTLIINDYGGLGLNDQPNNSGPIEGHPEKSAVWGGNDEDTSIQRIYEIPTNFKNLIDTHTNVAFNLYTRAGDNGDPNGTNEELYKTSPDGVRPENMNFELHTGTHPDHTVYRASVPGPERETRSACNRIDSGWVDVIVPLADFKTEDDVSIIDGDDLIITGWKFTTNQDKLHVFLSKIELQEP